MRSPRDIGDSIGAARLLPVLRLATADAADRLVRELAAAGLRALELTATTPGWEELLEGLSMELPQLLFGVGTLTTAAGAERAVAAGADFLVSPHAAPEVRRVASAADVLFVEGAFSPGEVAAAAAHGPAKLFPASIGGPAYLRSLLAIIPQASIIPTGGVSVEEVPAYLAAGAFAVGVGSDLLAPGAGERAHALIERIGSQ
ncbi:MAG: bifunctional 4-hydroxy-2-oxoglutarate aldolase/2-dehydro-3-deoxy-phosphogluconate aldolase [Gaiellaceae bacterium]